MDDLDTGGGTSGRLASQTKNQGRLRFRTQPDAGDAAGCKLQNRRHSNIKWNSNWMKCPLPPPPPSDCALIVHPHCCPRALSCSGALCSVLQLPLCGPRCAIEPGPEPRPTSKGKRRKHDFYVTRTLFSQSLHAGPHCSCVVGDPQWAASASESRQKIHDCDSGSCKNTAMVWQVAPRRQFGYEPKEWMIMFSSWIQPNTVEYKPSVHSAMGLYRFGFLTLLIFKQDQITETETDQSIIFSYKKGGRSQLILIWRVDIPVNLWDNNLRLWKILIHIYI